MELPKIKVADFEGPFDLLLHLIKKNKMDIYNEKIIKELADEIRKIAKKYKAFIFRADPAGRAR